MTEQEWLQATDPTPMLEFLRGEASDRKIRLYMCESYRKIPSERLPGNIRKAILVLERYAEGLASRKEILDARARAWESVTKFGEQSCRSRSGLTPEDRLHHARLAAIARGTSPDLFDGAIYIADPMLLPVTERPNQLGLLHDIFGNLFRLVTFDPVWRTPTVLALATAAYEQRVMPAGTLDPDRLAVLADTLEEAGCIAPEILGHLRGRGPHYRGCHILDLLRPDYR